MDRLTGEINVSYSDTEINARLKPLASSEPRFSRHFTDDEDFFLRVPSPLQVDSLPINVDAGRPPSKEYLRSLRTTMQQLATLIPQVLAGCVHVHDPSAHLQPLFIKLFTIGESTFVYLVRLDLTFRPRHHHVVTRGTNDMTASYWTTLVFLTVDLFPVSRVVRNTGKLAGLYIDQLFVSTFAGESGKGYQTQGVWLDREITREFSRLVLPTDANFYPYFPLTCKYQSITHPVIHFSREGIGRGVRILNDALPLIRKSIVINPEGVEDDGGVVSIAPSATSEWNEIRKRWLPVWRRLTVKGYFDDDSRKEFELIDGIR